MLHRSFSKWDCFKHNVLVYYMDMALWKLGFVRRNVLCEAENEIAYWRQSFDESAIELKRITRLRDQWMKLAGGEEGDILF